MGNLKAIKTKYSDKLEGVYSHLQEGKRKVADLTPDYGKRGVTLRLSVFGKGEEFSARGIGVNSFGMEVCLKDKYNCTSWVALEQLTDYQQQRVVKAIDWTTLH